MQLSRAVALFCPLPPIDQNEIEVIDLDYEDYHEEKAMNAIAGIRMKRPAHLSPDMAVGIEKGFGVSMDTLMRMQNSYDIAKARERAPKIDVAPFNAADLGLAASVP